MNDPTVLLVEDSPTDALIVKHALRRRFAVDHVRDAVEARELIAGGRYAAVITDYSLPVGDGLELLRWVNDLRLDVPVIMVSGRGDERVAAEAIKLGAYDYIVKSEDSLASLDAVIQQVLRRHELERRAQILQQIVEHASDAIITMQADGVILTANHAVQVLFGYTPEEAVGRPVSELFPQAPAEFDPAAMLTTGAVTWQGELTGRRKDGAQFPVHLSTSVLHDPADRTRCLIGIARDVTERRQLLDRLHRQSMTDNLTGLFNHRFFHERLKHEFSRARRYGQPLGCIMIDVDFFKTVNDAYGHLVGDEVLKLLAGILTQATRSVDILARYGGEEFAVLLPNTDLAGAVRCAEHIWESIGTSDIRTAEGTLRLTISAGVTAISSELPDEEALCRRADAALLAAKRRGRNNVCVWNRREFEGPGEEADPVGDRAEDLRRSMRRLAAPAKLRYLEAVRPLITAVCRRSPELQRHTESVSIYAVELARASGLPPEEVEAIRNAALVHDIGRAVVQEEAVEGPEPVGDDTHACISADMLMELYVFDSEHAAVRHHHERFDGAGRPDGLCGAAIPKEARILAVADAYDAFLVAQPDRGPEAHRRAEAQLLEHAGLDLDPDLVQTFVKCRGRKDARLHPRAASAI